MSNGHGGKRPGAGGVPREGGPRKRRVWYGDDVEYAAVDLAARTGGHSNVSEALRGVATGTDRIVRSDQVDQLLDVVDSLLVATAPSNRDKNIRSIAIDVYEITKSWRNLS